MPRGDIGAAFVMVAIFMPIGILGGLAVGAVPVLRSRGIRSGKQVAGYLAGVIATLLAVTAGIGGLYIYTVEDFMRDTPLLMFEIRVPDGQPLPLGDRIELRTDKNRMPGSFKPQQSVRKEGNVWVFAGNVEMYFKTSGRLLAFTLENKTELTYRINLPRTPTHSKTFGPWHRAEYITEPGKAPLRAGPQEGYEIRYRARLPARTRA
jgi:hypothetical protein